LVGKDRDKTNSLIPLKGEIINNWGEEIAIARGTSRLRVRKERRVLTAEAKVNTQQGYEEGKEKPRVGHHTTVPWSNDECGEGKDPGR